MIRSIKTVSGATVYARDIIRLPYLVNGEERWVYGTFGGMYGSSKRPPDRVKVFLILDILDGDEVLLGKANVIFCKGVPFTKARRDEVAMYKQKVLEKIKEERNETRN